MKLCKILACCTTFIGANASVTEKARITNDKGSEHASPTFSLVAELQPINTTHVNVSIKNTYPQQIAISKWNSLFQSNHNSAYQSFHLTHLLSNGSLLTLSPDSGKGQYRYMDPVPSHFVNIAADATYVNILDITKLFRVSDSGRYNLTLDLSRPATLASDSVELSSILATSGQQKIMSNSASLPKVTIKSDTISMDLEASLPTHMSQKRTAPQALCSSQSQSAAAAVLKARGNARSLAKFAQAKVLPPLGIAAHGLIDDKLWAQYFNNDSAAKNVSRIYDAIATYGINGQVNAITEFCDLTDSDHMCTDDGGAVSYSTTGDGTTGPSITFCKPFFSLPVAETCVAPGANNNMMSDQGGVYLYELAKSQQLTSVANVTDGVSDECWTWDCITSAAQKLNGETAWLLAGAYELFAYAARAQLSSLCPNAKAVGPEYQPSPPGANSGNERLPGVQQPAQKLPAAGLSDGVDNIGGDSGSGGSRKGGSGGSGGAAIGTGGSGG